MDTLTAAVQTVSDPLNTVVTLQSVTLAAVSVTAFFVRRLVQRLDEIDRTVQKHGREIAILGDRDRRRKGD